MVEGIEKQLPKASINHLPPVAMTTYCTLNHDNVCALDVEKEMNLTVRQRVGTFFFFPSDKTCEYGKHTECGFFFFFLSVLLT